MGKRTDQGGWPPSGFGPVLKSHREGRGMTQAALADAAGCNKFTVAKLEAGTQEPAWPLVLALADALGVSTEAFRPPGRRAERRSTPTSKPAASRRVKD